MANILLDIGGIGDYCNNCVYCIWDLNLGSTRPACFLFNKVPLKKIVRSIEESGGCLSCSFVPDERWGRCRDCINAEFLLTLKIKEVTGDY